MWKKTAPIMALALMATSASAIAGACEDSFEAIGDPRNGQVFNALIKKPGMKIESALGQIRKLATDEGHFVSADNIKGKQGQLFVMQTTTRTPVVTQVNVDAAGNIFMGVRLAKTQSMTVEGARGAMCGMLNQLKTGKEGEAIAAAARAASPFNTPTSTTAVALSGELGKETKLLARTMQDGSFKDMLFGDLSSPNALRESRMLPLAARYVGRPYIIDGQVYTAIANQYSGVFEVGYLVTKRQGLLQVKQSASRNNDQFTVHCELAADQAKLAAALGSEDWVKLPGIVGSFDLRGIRLRECRQAS